MKRMLGILLAFVFCVASFSLITYAQTQPDIMKTQLGDSTTYYEYDAESKTLTISGEGAMPDMKNNASSQPWYDWRSDGSIEHVIIAEGITRIGNYCFYSVKANDFTIPNTIQSVGRYAFCSSSITDAVLPFGLTAIESYAFDACDALANLQLPDTLKTIGSYAFRLCSALESVMIPYSVTSIGSYAFDRCIALVSVIFEDMTASLTLGSYAFYDCLSLSNVAYPSGATLATKSYAYGRNGKINGAAMRVYDASSAHIYAMTNSVSYEVLDDAYALRLGVPNHIAFDENTTDKEYTFTFTPSFSGVYHFYSRGDMDVKASLYSGASLLVQNDDISDSDRNFCVTYELTEGTVYTFTVQSMKEQGSATVVIYPDRINSFDVYGSLTFNASDGFRGTAEPLFPIADRLLTNFVLDIHFDGGYSDKIYYAPGYFDNRQISLCDTQSTEPFTCGENREKIRIGDTVGSFPVFVNHTYTGEAVPYTVDEDGYTLYTCLLCGDSYIGDIIETPAITVSGRCVLMTDPDGSVDYRIPLAGSTVTFNGREVAVDEDGRFSFRTLESGTVTISNPYCDGRVYPITFNYKDINFGAIGLPAYDFNRDGYINGRDMAYFKIHYEKTYGKQYFRYAVNFM
ncbi:MAG: hypothetical protein E7520_03355 [Ruminococcaceae bacterium]|nr:hypothetical protein [Oscillospiraceae bacterium]